MPALTLDAVFAYAHFFGIGCLVAVLAMETALLAERMAAHHIKRMARIDLGYGLAAALVLIAGAGRVVYDLKGPMFYMSNPAFWVKMSLFAATGLLSVIPTLEFIRWRRAITADAGFHPPPERIRRMQMIVRVEWLLLALIPLAAVFMARGIGM